jgi:O-antigen/teichoic acid export membrane protein
MSGINNTNYEKNMNLKDLEKMFCNIFKASLYNNAFYLMLNTAATSVLGFIFWNIMTRFFSQAEVGIGTVLLSASGLIASLASLGLGVGLVRYMPEVGEDQGRLNNSVFTLIALLSGICALVYLIAIPRIAPALSFVRQSIPLLIMFLFLTVISAIFAMADQSLIAGRAARFVFWKNTLASILKMPLPVIIFAALGGYGIFAGTGLSLLAALLVTLFFFMPRVFPGYYPCPSLSGELISRILPYSFSNYLAGLLNTAPIYIFPLMALNMLGPEQSAYYYMAWMIATVLSIIPSSFTQSLFAEASHEPGKLGSHGRRALIASLLLSLPAVLVMMVLGRWILHIFGAAYAENGIGVFRYLVLSIIPACLIGFYFTVNQVKKRVGLVVLMAGFLSVTTLGLGYWLLKMDGLSGLGMAYDIAEGSLALMIVWPLWNDLKPGQDAPSLSR